MSLFYQLYSQKDRKAMPSAADKPLSDVEDSQRSREETIARNVAFVAYAGTWCT